MKLRLPKKMRYCVIFLALLLSASACGRMENPEQEGAGEGMTAVADFHYMELDQAIDESFQGQYAINGEWIYIMEATYFVMAGDEDSSRYIYVSRNRISDGYREQNYIMRERGEKEGLPQAFLADGAGNCYLFWSAYYGEEDAVYALEKYGTEGELLWRREYAPEELQDIGNHLRQGTVTEDGRVLLYSYGEGGRVFVFGEEGSLVEVYVPKLEALEGIAVGKDGRTYGYNVTGQRSLFMELGGEQPYVCPVVPLEVYSGYAEGICLRTGDGMWAYDPETGEAERLWGWEDEYIQISGDYVDRVFCGDGRIMMLCAEQDSYFKRDPNYTRTVLTFAGVTFEDSREYPERQAITLSVSYRHTCDQLVKRYNRQSRKYRVEICLEENASALEMKLVQGNGPDLINISDLYAGNLAEQGAFEDLGPYYEASEAVDREDILDSVRRACTVRGKEIGVIPAFEIKSYFLWEICSTPEEWTVWNFLEMGQERRMLYYQEPWEALTRCMGIRYGEHFVDWEKRECYFDSEEFRRMLELCSTWETYKPGLDEDEGERLLSLWTVSSVKDLVSGIMYEDLSARLPGFPGWGGGEYELVDYGMYAINSASEHKEGAWDFLEYLLSEEYQDKVYWAFPVRKSSFEASMENFYISPNFLKLSWHDGDPVMPTEEDYARLRDMVDSAVYNNFGGTNNPIYNILADEVYMYLAGDATLDDTVRKIQNRMQIYLDER